MLPSLPNPLAVSLPNTTSEISVEKNLQMLTVSIDPIDERGHFQKAQENILNRFQIK
jgi:hypothetical protein